jgi:hypothetical protein
VLFWAGKISTLFGLTKDSLNFNQVLIEKGPKNRILLSLFCVCACDNAPRGRKRYGIQNSLAVTTSCPPGINLVAAAQLMGFELTSLIG